MPVSMTGRCLGHCTPSTRNRGSCKHAAELGGACRYYPFGQGSGERVQQDFGLPHLIRFPILPELSEAGDGEASTATTQHHTQPLVFARGLSTDRAESPYAFCAVAVSARRACPAFLSITALQQTS